MTHAGRWRTPLFRVFGSMAFVALFARGAAAGEDGFVYALQKVNAGANHSDGPQWA